MPDPHVTERRHQCARWTWPTPNRSAAAVAACGAALVLTAPHPALLAQTGATPVATLNRFIPHTSTVPATAGERVGLFLHERVREDRAEAPGNGTNPDQVVLFVHGISVPSVSGFDLPYKDYSWMEFLAREGFDTFSLDLTGYGLSPRPHMDDPCNLSPAEQQVALPSAPPCPPSYGFRLTTSQSEWDEIDTAVDYIRALRGVDRVSLVGWSQGGVRVGGYAVLHPEKIARVVMFAPAYRRRTPDTAPPAPEEGRPMRLQTKTTLLEDRWRSTSGCAGIEPGLPDRVWQSIMSFDSYGSVWAQPDGVMRVVGPNTTSVFNAKAVARIQAPVLVVVGMLDTLLPNAEAMYADLAGTDSRVLVKMACASHFALWELTQHRFLHEASLEWLRRGTFRSATNGEFTVDTGGRQRPAAN